MSHPDSTPNPAAPARPGWVDRLLAFLGSQDGAAPQTPAPAPIPVPAPKPQGVVEHTPAGDIYRL
jgi:hypothetical protein